MGAPVGLYVHVPFCASKCPYCDFYSLRTHDSAFMEAYAAAAEQVMEQYAEAGLTADSLYFGGGTPSVLPPELFSRLSRRAIHLFSIPAHSEITVECNPETVSRRCLKQLRRLGVNRLSFGAQSFQCGYLRAEETGEKGRHRTGKPVHRPGKAGGSGEYFPRHYAGGSRADHGKPAADTAVLH